MKPKVLNCPHALPDVLSGSNRLRALQDFGFHLLFPSRLLKNWWIWLFSFCCSLLVMWSVLISGVREFLCLTSCSTRHTSVRTYTAATAARFRMRTRL